ncbi:MAG: ATPase [Balneolaceae bacterium]|nr:MAG: ATPase [Balneolaceae bacterium]
MNRQRVRITKASGEKVPFSEEKLRNSLERSGATESQIDFVVDEVHDLLYEGIPTGKIYRKAYDMLRKRSRSKAARYKLKKAIMELGPSGYPFEHFVGAILEHQGFRTEVGVVVEGRCVSHEIDVLAEKNSKLILVECKFHNRPGVKCDVKVPLYIHSRFRDVEMSRNSNSKHFTDYEGWIVTNTRFTDDAISYGTCSGLVMLGWDYPGKSSLKNRIGLAGLHPVTCLSSLNRKEKEFLLEKGVVLCRTVPDETGLLRELGLSEARIAKVERECDELVHELDVPKE